MAKSFGELNNEKKDSLTGWEELKIIQGEKIGKEIELETSKGKMLLTTNDLLYQHLFRAKLFECFNFLPPKVKSLFYENWLQQWTKLIKEIEDNELSTHGVIQESLPDFLVTAVETNEMQYLNKEGISIQYDDGFLFKANDYWNWLKKNKGLQISPNKLYFYF